MHTKLRHIKRCASVTAASLVALVCLGAAASPLAVKPMAGLTDDWLTISGEPDEAIGPTLSAPDIVQVKPRSLAGSRDTRTLLVRVSRGALRTSGDGAEYRSYASVVEFDCSHSAARHLWIDYHREALWRGTPHKSMVFPRGSVRPVALGDTSPNSVNRLLRAACKSGAVVSN